MCHLCLTQDKKRLAKKSWARLGGWLVLEGLVTFRLSLACRMARNLLSPSSSLSLLEGLVTCCLSLPLSLLEGLVTF